MKVRLDKLLANRGYATRSQVRLELWRVLVDGEKPLRTDDKVEPESVTWNGEPLDPESLLIVMNKPAGLTCSHEDRGALVYELLPERYVRRNPPLSSAGRLDRDTTGVLLFTDDGPLLHRLTSPRFKAAKVYEVELDMPLQAEHIPVLCDGTLELDGAPVRPAHLETLPDGRVLLELNEGKYHQVKRMFAALGYSVTSLHRRFFAGLGTGDLQLGEYRSLTSQEEANLRSSVGL